MAIQNVEQLGTCFCTVLWDIVSIMFCNLGHMR